MVFTDRIKNSRPVVRARTWYAKYEKPISSFVLVFGFIMDSVTLKIVNAFWENVWMSVNLTLLGTFIILVHAFERQEGDEANAEKVHFWLVNLQQFFFGAVLSTFLVFYFSGSDPASSWPFLLLLAVSFASNEFIKRNYVRLVYQISFYFLCIFSFSIFLVPTLIHKIGQGVFIFSGFCSLLFITIFLLIIRATSRKQFEQSQMYVIASIAAIFTVVNVFYFTNFIPPLPLTVKDYGVYYSVQRKSDGNFAVTGEKRQWYDYFKLYKDFDYLPGQPVYVYTAVYSPSGLNTNIIHEWQRKDDATGEWKTVTKVQLKVNGGRNKGFRTFSQKTTGLTPGRWQVNVKTTQGQIIGRVRFDLHSADELPKVEQIIKK